MYLCQRWALVLVGAVFGIAECTALIFAFTIYRIIAFRKWAWTLVFLQYFLGLLGLKKVLKAICGIAVYRNHSF